MDTFVDGRDFELLEGDRYTFYVLSRILKGPCRVVLSDHSRLIICHSSFPHPVWIWTPDDMTELEAEAAYEAVKETCPLSESRCNLKYPLAEYFVKKSRSEGIEAKIITNMLAYDCIEPLPPEETEGYFHICTPSDADEAVELSERFYEETGLERVSREEQLRGIQDKIKDGRLFFWKDEKGETAACCSYTVNDGMAAVSGVYTMPEKRRRGFAENMVYQATLKAKREGATPMLYADADYAAANACYQKIGYVQRGRLCTIGVK